MNPMQVLLQMRQDPSKFLSARGLNIPQGMNDPNEIINHLIQSGQVSQDRYNQVMQLFQMKR
jgi:hypothetical protein